jgi:RNA polymerase sigma factor (sigma-70 family)
VRRAGFAETRIVADHPCSENELAAMACCPGEDFTPAPLSDDLAAALRMALRSGSRPRVPPRQRPEPLAISLAVQNQHRPVESQRRWLAENAAYRNIAAVMADGDSGDFLTADQERGLASWVRRWVDMSGWEWATVTDAELEVAFTGRDAHTVLITSFLPLVRHIVGDYLDRGLSREDLVQEGSIALMYAIWRFDPERGIRFSSYATPCVRRHIQRAIEKVQNVGRLPRHTLRLIKKMYRIIDSLNSFIDSAGREPRYIDPDSISNADLAVVAKYLEVTPEQVSLLLQLARGPVSFSQSLHDGRSPEDVFVLEDGSSQGMLVEALLEKLETVLTPLEREVLHGRYGIGGGPPLTLATLAQSKQCSIEWIRQVERKAMIKLRNALETPSNRAADSA